MGDWQAALPSHGGAGSAQVYRAGAEGQMGGDELLAAARTPSGTLDQQPSAEQPAEALPEAASALPPQLERAASSVGPPVAAQPPRRAAAAQPPATAWPGRGRPPRSAAQAAAGAWQELREELRQPASSAGRSTRSSAAALAGRSTEAAVAASAGSPQRTPPQLLPRTVSGLSPGGQMARKRSLQDLLQGAELPAAGAAPEGQQAPAAPSLPPLPPLAGLPALPQMPAAAGWPHPTLAPAGGLSDHRAAAGQALQLPAASGPPLPQLSAVPAAGPQLTVSPPALAGSSAAAAAAAAAEGPKPAGSASTGAEPESSGEWLEAPPAEPALLYHERRLQYQAQRHLAPQV